MSTHFQKEEHNTKVQIFSQHIYEGDIEFGQHFPASYLTERHLQMLVRVKQETFSSSAAVVLCGRLSKQMSAEVIQFYTAPHIFRQGSYKVI